MIAISRTPRMLVKLFGAPSASTFTFQASPINARFDRLFHSIGPSGVAFGVVSQPEWYLVSAQQAAAEVNAWDLCHHLVTQGFGVTGLDAAVFAEPDLEQQWTTGTPTEHALAAARPCEKAADPDSRLPPRPELNPFWFRDSEHSQLEDARSAVGQPSDRVRIAHLDTGYDPNHETKPLFLLTTEPKNLQRNFIDDNSPDDATDHTSGILTNLGHGTGTLSILAGAAVNNSPLGGAPFLDVIPVRVANSVVLFRNSAIAKAFDYVHGLFDNPETRAHVITMSMGGLASQAWTDAVNALYEQGVFIVTAAGNNFFNLPTHNIVYPARYKRVVAACGVMADGRPYADLGLNIMAGNYGPSNKMQTALAAFTPNTPWARLGCSATVDHDGKGTSAATPQIAAAAALWIQTFKNEWEQYTEGWMKVEAVRKALFDSARLTDGGLGERLGRGTIRAKAALSQRPALAANLTKQPPDSASFPFLRVITGIGVSATVSSLSAHDQMLELEALQISQRYQQIEQLLPDPEHPADISPADRQRLLELLHDAPGASLELRSFIGKHVAPAVRPSTPMPAELSQADAVRLEMAMHPATPQPLARKLRVFAFDPLLGYNPDFLQLNETTLDVPWEELQVGPVGEYVEVVDVDPSSASCYAPVDLNHPTALSQAGLPPSESNPRFHQQMVYAVAMKTIGYFEHALGRVALWAPRFVKDSTTARPKERYVRRLRIYPHALREANSFYSPDKKALLLGYFPASETDPDENLPGGTVFCSLSHDIIAHETTHALLDGLHRYFREPVNEDMLAFHEAFADVVALFQHFTVPEALRDQIARTQGDLSKQNMLGQLAGQFGKGIGRYGALRSAIGNFDPETKQWKPAIPTRDDYKNATEPHDKGAVLVAAVFDAFLNIYRRRSEDLIRLATKGTGVLEPGEIPRDLVNRLAREAAKTAGHVLNICIRALDYCPPVDLRFGEYLRALITADRDLVPDDAWGYRPAFIQGFRRRGIYPYNVKNLSSESLCWERPQSKIPLDKMFKKLELSWDLRVDRTSAFEASQRNASRVHEWIKNDPDIKDEHTEALGFYRGEGNTFTVNGKPGKLRDFDVHSVRPVRRIGPDGQQRTDLVIEITQSWLPDDGSGKFRGGCTLIVDLEKRNIRYVIRKRVAHPDVVREQEKYQMHIAASNLGFNYYGNEQMKREPFAMMHRGI